MKNRVYNTLPYVILIICLAASLFIWKNLSDFSNLKSHDRFASLRRQTLNAIKERLATYTDAHFAGAAMFLASEDVTSADWRHFVRVIKINDRYPGINGIGYALPLSNKDTAAFLRKVRREDTVNFKIKILDRRYDTATHYVIRFIEPIYKNRQALGLDMGSEPTRRQAMDIARDSAKPTISAKVILVQDTNQSPGFLMYIPFYKDDSIPSSVSERRKNFLGWIYAPFITADFIRGILKHNLSEIKEEIALEIYDQDTSNEANLMYRSPNWNASEPVMDSLGNFVSLNLYLQNWKVRLRPTKAFSGQYQNNQPLLIFIASVLLSLALFYIAQLLASTRNKAMAMAESITQELRVKNIEVGKKNIELERSNKDLEQFAYVASHDLKEPLRMVNIYVQRLQNLIKASDAEVKESMEFISEGATRMNILIQDLLEYARVGHSSADAVVIDLNELAQYVLNDSKETIEEVKAEINIESLPAVTANKEYIVSLFENLIQNAIKFRKPDQKPEITIGAVRQNGVVIFSIADNGIGIQEDYAEKVFVLFQRLHNRSTYRGTGIGLAICKKIVELYGGSIWLKSKPGIGTTVYFTLPQARPAFK
jgi:signal transduction histidine kinase